MYPWFLHIFQSALSSITHSLLILCNFGSYANLLKLSVNKLAKAEYGALLKNSFIIRELSLKSQHVLLNERGHYDLIRVKVWRSWDYGIMIIKSLHHSGHLASLMATELSIPASICRWSFLNGSPHYKGHMRGQLEETSQMLIGVSET